MINIDVFRTARERLGLTQTELAQRVSSHQSAISEIERGALDPPVGVFLELCEALDIRPTALLPHESDSPDALGGIYMVQGHVAWHFLTGRHAPIGEVFQELLDDLSKIRVDVLALTIHMFDRRPMRYAGAIAGRYGVTWRENVDPDPDGNFKDSRGVLFSQLAIRQGRNQRWQGVRHAGL